MQNAEERAKLLRVAEELAGAKPYPVAKWHTIPLGSPAPSERTIPDKPGIYMFSERRRRVYIGSATSTGGIEARLRHQTYAPRIARDGSGWTRWTKDDPPRSVPPKSVRSARNLLSRVLLEDFCPAFDLPGSADPPFPRDIFPPDDWPNWPDAHIEALNKAFERIHKMTVQWVELAHPDDWPNSPAARKAIKRTAHRAEQVAICLLQPSWGG